MGFEYRASFQIEQEGDELVGALRLKLDQAEPTRQDLLDLADRLNEAADVTRQVAKLRPLAPGEESEASDTRIFLLDLRPMRTSQESQGLGPDRDGGEGCLPENP